MVVVDGQITVIEVTDQRRPAAEAVLDGFRRRRAVRNLSTLAGEPLSERLGNGLRTLLAHLSPAVGVELLLSGFALDVVQGREQPQRLLGDVAAVIGVQIVELPASVGHAADFDHTALEQRFVARVVVADEFAGPGSEELTGVQTAAAVGKVVDHRAAVRRIRYCCSSTDRPDASDLSQASTSVPASHRHAALPGSEARLSAHRPVAVVSSHRHRPTAPAWIAAAPVLRARRCASWR